MTVEAAQIPERGSPPAPSGWPADVHNGPAARDGCVPSYLLDRGEFPSGEPPDHHLETLSGGEHDVEESCDVAVVGSGAGGAALAAAAAEAGLRVIVLEEGDHFTSADFEGAPIDRVLRFYRNGGSTAALGKSVVPIPVGKTVGGTTTVNSGTCFRAPRSILDAWASTYGIPGIDHDSMDPYFRRVEEVLNVRPVPWELLGPNGWLSHYGARSLGLTGGPILRNITACHGSGQCAFGCPTDAKQSVNLSYLPRAFRSGGRIYRRTRAEWVMLEGGRAVGLTGRFLGDADEPLGSIRVRSGAVVVAAGALITPVFLAANHIGDSSRQVGRNLSIHPAAGVAGIFDEPIYGWRGTLQPYYIDTLFESHGAMLEATNAVPSVAASILPNYGAEAKEMIADFPHLGTLGLLVSDTTTGRVRRGPGGDPIVTYTLNDRDASVLYRGLALASEIMFAAGATSVIPGVSGLDRIDDEGGIEDLRSGRGAAAIKLAAYHPMGTARMGSDPESSVVDGNHETHDIRGLYVCDASVFPSCLGVNPQVTIMAFATRFGEILASRLG